MQFGDIGLAPGAIRSRSAAYAKRVGNAQLYLDAANEAVAGLQRDGHVFGVTKGQFSMIDIATAVLQKTGPADVSVWTWCIADYEVDAIGGFLASGAIRDFRLVMDWAGAQRDMPIVAELQAKYGNDCIRVTKTHAKIVTIGNDDWRVVIRGSMNLNANPRFEQFDISDGGPAWDVMAEITAEMWARAKPLPVKKLKHTDAVDLFGGSAEIRHSAPDWAAGGSAKWWNDGRQEAKAS